MKKIIIIIIMVLVVVIIGGGIGIFMYTSNNTDTTSKTVSKENAITASNSKANTNENETNASNTDGSTSTTKTTANAVSTRNTSSTSENNGNGNFSSIVNGAKYFSGNIEGDTIIIPLNDGTVVNNQLILKEYYVDRLNEVFTLKIDSEGNNNYTFYEYYNGVNTGIFKLKATTSQGEVSLNGTYSKPGSDSVIGISLQAYTNGNIYPFYCGVVDNTPVTFINKEDGSGYYEKYAGDNNLFSVVNDYYYKNNYQKYNEYLDEEFGGRVTGEYEVNVNENGEDIKGIYIPASNKNVEYPVTLIGSFTPN
ncbi:MAG: hypothetical protein ACRDAU_07290 [Clostridium sp.]